MVKNQSETTRSVSSEHSGSPIALTFFFLNLLSTLWQGEFTQIPSLTHILDLVAQRFGFYDVPRYVCQKSVWPFQTIIPHPVFN